ncbi:MAG: hypothetical protein JEZ06_20820 [Anaerolineaceae bacterium]|nr:hypothetical protein [Anaerolineaceae bacterium]
MNKIFEYSEKRLTAGSHSGFALFNAGDYSVFYLQIKMDSCMPVVILNFII